MSNNKDHLVVQLTRSCRAILGHSGDFGLFGAVLDPQGALKRPQGGPLWHIIMYKAPEPATKAILGKTCTFSNYLGAQRTVKSQKVGPFDYLENWAPHVPQNPPWAHKHP